MVRLRGLLPNLPEEVWFFLRISAYAIFIGAVYWFLTYEAAGTMLLLGFGIAGGFGALVLGLGARGRGRARADGGPAAAEGGRVAAEAAEGASGLRAHAPFADARADAPFADAPFADESGRIPGATAAPFMVGVGVALAGLGLVFGPWLLLAGGAIGVAAALDWGRSATEEYRSVESGLTHPRSDPAAAASVEGSRRGPAG